MLTFVNGPLGFPASKNWRYWIPTLPNGKFRAWYHVNGLPGHKDDKILGDDLESFDEAKKLCEEHNKQKCDELHLSEDESKLEEYLGCFQN